MNVLPGAAEVTVEWHPRLARVGIVEGPRGQRPERVALLDETLCNGEAPARVQAVAWRRSGRADEGSESSSGSRRPRGAPPPSAACRRRTRARLRRASRRAPKGSSFEPGGERRYRGGSPASSIRLTVRRLIPSRRAISRWETPSTAMALACAHSNTLRTSRAASRLDRLNRSSVRTQAVVTGRTGGALLAARSWCSIGRPASDCRLPHVADARAPRSTTTGSCL